MKKEVIIVRANDATVAKLYELVKHINDTTSIRAYQSVGNECVVFPNDKDDKSFVESLLTERGFEFRVEDAGKATLI